MRCASTEIHYESVSFLAARNSRTNNSIQKGPRFLRHHVYEIVRAKSCLCRLLRLYVTLLMCTFTNCLIYSSSFVSTMSLIFSDVFKPTRYCFLNIGVNKYLLHVLSLKAPIHICSRRHFRSYCFVLLVFVFYFS